MTDAPKTTDAAGKWDVTIFTPLGEQRAAYEFQSSGGGVVGTATQNNETMELEDCVIAGDQMTFTQKIQKPMRLTLKFDVAVNGDELQGVAKAGVLPASRVVGRRVGDA